MGKPPSLFVIVSSPAKCRQKSGMRMWYCDNVKRALTPGHEEDPLQLACRTNGAFIGTDLDLSLRFSPRKHGFCIPCQDFVELFSVQETEKWRKLGPWNSIFVPKIVIVRWNTDPRSRLKKAPALTKDQITKNLRCIAALVKEWGVSFSLEVVNDAYPRCW